MNHKLFTSFFLVIILLALAVGLLTAAPVSAAIYSVTTTADSGPGSLRQAILDANANPGTDAITFNIGALGSSQTISLTTALPVVSDPTLLDGWSQGGSGYAGPPLVEINGSNISNWNIVNGLEISAGDSTVRGLAINYFNIAISLTSAGNNVIEGNYLGLALDGDTAVGNRTGMRISAASDGNRIGTDGDGLNDAAERNVISAAGLVQVNNSVGILIDPGSDNHWIAGNFIGTDATGTLDRGNASNGINTGGFAIIGTNGDGMGDAVEGNLISGNNGHGILLSTNSNSSRVAGNLIGTDVTGSVALPNNSNGVSVGSCSPGHCSDYIIGTNGDGVSDALEGNLISGNGADGVFIPAGTLTNNIVAGNKIGTNISGTAAIPNGDYGVHFGGDFGRLGTNNDGLSDALEGNLISGNDNHGVVIPGGSDHNLVAGNKIGTNVDGTAALPNGQTGVRVEDDFNTLTGNLISTNGEYGIYLNNAFSNAVTGNHIGTTADGLTALGNTLHGIYISINSDDNLIGGTGAGEGNTIAFNGGDGVFVDNNCGATFCIRNRIVGNSLFENAGLGIDLFPNGVNANDPLDPDTGANTRQNYPTLTAATSVGINLIITGTLNSAANLTFTLDFYSSSACDPAGFGEGAVYLGAGQTATDANGDAAFALSVTGIAQSGDAVTATATDPDGNTSEFSGCITAVGEEPITGLEAFNDSPTFLGLTTHFSVTLTGGTGVGYAWDFGDGVTGSGAAPAHSYTATGSYTATVTATNSLGSAVDTTAIMILTSPVCAATPDDGVTVFGSLDAAAVQQAVDTLQAAGGTVKIAGTCAGVSARNGFTQTVYIEDMMTLAGGYSVGNWTTPDPESPAVLDALGMGRVIFALGAPLTLENLILVNGNGFGSGSGFCPDSGCGGGLFTHGSLTLENVLFENNQANRGGGAYVAGALVAVDSDWLDNTSTTQRGGGLEVYGDAALTGGLVQGNAATAAGGIFADVGLVISGTQFISNMATIATGGALYSSGPLDITNALFEGNQSDDGGGAVSHSPALNELLAILNTQFINNTTLNNAAQGGALVTTATASTIQASTFQGNSALGSNGKGGAIFSFGKITLTETTLISNTAGSDGGAIYKWGSTGLVIANSLLAGNQAGDAGGGVYFTDFGTPSNIPIQFINTTFEHNTAALEGGGAYLGLPGIISGNLFLENHSSSAEGGGLFSKDQLTLAQTTFQGNTALGASGAYVEGELTVSDTDWLDNTCTTNEGGALEVYGDTLMTGGLVQGNSCAYAGGIFSNGGLVISGTHFLSNTAASPSIGLGGAVYAIGSLDLTNVLFQSNQAQSGAGGAYVDGTLQAVNSNWLDNSCITGRGGAFQVYDEAMLTSGLIQGNGCRYAGGVFADAGLVISGTQFISNTATNPTVGSGGAIYSSGPLDITNALFEGNHSYTGGGAVLHSPALNELLAILNTQFINNTTLNNAAQGGALVTTATASTIQASIFQGNSAPGSNGNGGAIVAYQEITLTETTLISNTAGFDGGAIYHHGLSGSGGNIYPLVIANSLLAGNQAGDAGGGVYFRKLSDIGTPPNIPIQIMNTTFENNSSWLQGGGVYLGQPAQIENSTFRGNSSLGSGGGGIFAFRNLILAKSFLIGNFAYANGGGLALQGPNNAPSQITNAVFSGNSTFLTAASLYVNNPGSLDILYTTLAGTDSSAQGIAVSGANVEITNAILVSHTVGIVASGGAVVTADHTLFHGNQTDVQGVTNLDPVYGNPQFLDAANGDFHLTLGSPAVDAGTTTSVLSDFEDDLRPIIAQSDLGADEFGDSATGNPGSTTTIGTGQIIITIPPGALDGPGNILFLPTFPPTFIPPTPWLPISPGFQLIVTPAGFAPTEIASPFLLPITVTLTYTDSALGGIDESTLFLAVLDEISGEWVDATTTCTEPGILIRNPNENQLIVTTCATGEFALIGIENASGFQIYLPVITRYLPQTPEVSQPELYLPNGRTIFFRVILSPRQTSAEVIGYKLGVFTDELKRPHSTV